jgi:predicted dinucleotide-binding enzyme
MKLSTDPCQIVGVRAGEIEINLLNPEQPTVNTKFVLLREDGTHAGQYSKSAAWSDKAVKAFQEFISAMEDDVIRELFVSSEETPQVVVGDQSPAPQDVPTLGDKKGVPQI